MSKLLLPNSLFPINPITEESDDEDSDSDEDMEEAMQQYTEDFQL